MRIKYRLPRIDTRGLKRLYAHFGPHLAPYRAKLFASGLALLGLSLLTLITPWPIKIVLDYALLPDASANTPDRFSFLYDWDPSLLIGLAALAVVALAGLRGLCMYTHQVLTKGIGHRLVADIRLKLFAHVQRLPQTYHDYRETGELLTRLTGDIGLLQDLLTSTLIRMISQVALVIGMFAVMFWLDIDLAWAALAIMPLFVAASFRFSVRIRSSARRQREAYGRMVASVQESIAGIQHVKTYGQERQREKMVGKSMERDVRVNVKTARLAANYARVVDIITALGTGLVLWLGAHKVLNGTITPGDLIIYLSYVRSVYRPVRELARNSTRVAKSIARGEKVVELFEMVPEVIDTPHGASAKQIRGAIDFEGVHFSYVKGTPILRDFSCHIPANRTTMIIGRTGAGKSTVAKLAMRLYDVDAGTISVDGDDIRHYRLTSLRRRITPMSQDTYLFRASLADNIGFGKKRALRSEIEEAACLVGADAFIDQLPDGLDTVVGEGGLTLSGGQRQKISFARAAIRRSPVMIFDEPATGLDIHAERHAMDVLRRLRHNRTLLIITHRLRFLELADHIILIEGGRVTAQGTPTELLAGDGMLRAYAGPDHALLTEAVLRAQQSEAWVDG